MQSAVFREQKDYNWSLTGLFVEDKQIIHDVDWFTKAFFSPIVVQGMNVEVWWRHLHLPCIHVWQPINQYNEINESTDATQTQPTNQLDTFDHVCLFWFEILKKHG